MPEILPTIHTILARLRNPVVVPEIGPGDELADLLMDDVDLVGLTLALEEAFGIEISDAVMESWLTVGDVVRAVEHARGRVGA